MMNFSSGCLITVKISWNVHRFENIYSFSLLYKSSCTNYAKENRLHLTVNLRIFSRVATEGGLGLPLAEGSLNQLLFLSLIIHLWFSFSA